MRKETNTSAIIVIFFVALLLLVLMIVGVGGGWYLMARQAVVAQQAEMQMQRALAESLRAKAEADLARQAALLDSGAEAEQQKLRIEIDEQGRLKIEDRPVERQEAKRHLTQAHQQPGRLTVEITADSNTPFQLVAELTELCSELEGVEVTLKADESSKE